MELKLSSDSSISNLLKIRKYTVLPLLTVLIMIVLTAMVAVPRINLILTTRKNLKASQEKLDILEAKFVTLEEMNEDELLDIIGHVEKVLPSYKAVVDWILTLRSMAVDSSIPLGVLSFLPGSIATESASPSALARQSASSDQSDNKLIKQQQASRRVSDVEFFELSINVESTFSRIMDLISKFDDVSPLMKVTGLQLVFSGKTRNILTDIESQNIKLKADIGLLLFYSEPPEILGSIDEKVVPFTDSDKELYDKLLSYKEYTQATAAAVNVGRENVFAPL